MITFPITFIKRLWRGVLFVAAAPAVALLITWKSSRHRGS